MATKPILIGSVVAVVLGVAVLVVLTRQPGAPACPMVPPDTIAPIRDRGSQGAVRARLLEIGNSALWNDEEAGYVLQAAHDPTPLVRAAGDKVVGNGRDPVESLVARRTALVIMSRCLVDENVPPEVGKKFKDTIVAALHNDHPRIRSTAIACVAESRLLQRPEVRQLVCELRQEVEREYLLDKVREFHHAHIDTEGIDRANTRWHKPVEKHDALSAVPTPDETVWGFRASDIYQGGETEPLMLTGMCR